MKGERVAQLELLLHSHPEGLRRSEIARRLGVHRSTISRYIDDLKKYIDIYEDNNLIKIHQKEGEEPISLSIYESLAFNLSAEALATNSELQSPHLSSGLKKIAMNMRSYAPSIADNIVSLAESIDIELKKKEEQNKQFNTVLEVLIDSWVSGKMVQIQHISGSTRVETEFAPYFIGFREDETGRNPISVTGRLRHTSEIITIDITSIVSAVIIDETYTIPDNLKPFQQHKPDNGYDSVDFVPLTLKLKEKSAMNSFHNLTHTPPRYSKDERGSTICKMEVENSIELLLRIIQCGNAVEVIGPESFRKKYVSYLKRILEIYPESRE
ncbi:MAG: WYL domain-containing protein [Sphaerochaetaceae bacterium]|nr:WYL domain-containing protein [Sphaerochaetaceae bacterium]MDC7248069.1 WYL domain-containing protein [Sphaerochaetaceae bacterium]